MPLFPDIPRPSKRYRKHWRDARLDDIAILAPAQTPRLIRESALDEDGIPNWAVTSSLVYRTREVRDVLMAARAIDDPSDALALVSALRSPLFGFGYDDLGPGTLGADGGTFRLRA